MKHSSYCQGQETQQEHALPCQKVGPSAQVRPVCGFRRQARARRCVLPSDTPTDRSSSSPAPHPRQTWLKVQHMTSRITSLNRRCNELVISYHSLPLFSAVVSQDTRVVSPKLLSIFHEEHPSLLPDNYPNLINNNSVNLAQVKTNKSRMTSLTLLKFISCADATNADVLNRINNNRKCS